MAKLNKDLREEIIGYLESGLDIPADYKNSLFPPEKKEYELIYAEKEREEEIVQNTWGVPLQPVKTFGIQKVEETPAWTNRLIFGDNLQVMKRLLEDLDVKGKVKLIYIDPPFATKRDQRTSKSNKAYQDKIEGAEFIEFIRKRLILLRELLADDGCIYIHLDQKKSHYIKVVADEVFGEGNFLNEIAWKRTNSHNEARQYGRIHDVLLFYSKSPDYTYHPKRIPFSPAQMGRYKKHLKNGRLFTCQDLTGERKNSNSGKFEWRGTMPGEGRGWGYDIEQLEAWWADDRIATKKDGTPRQDGLIVYLDEKEGQLPQSIWDDVPRIANTSKERLDYPTQKPEALLERIILASSDPKDLVLDVFAGSGTTLSVAEKLGRRWVGVDCGKLAIYTIQKRLLNLKKDIGNKGRKYKIKPFTLYNAGLYDFARMKNLPWEDYRRFALQLFQVRDDKHELGGIALDGYKGDSDVLIFNFKEHENIYLDSDYIHELHKFIGNKVRNEFFIIAPAARVTFLEDYIDVGSCRYYILRIPYSIIDELHNRPFVELRQPIDENEVNNTVEAVGFDFIVPPEVEAAYILQSNGALLPKAFIHVKKFKSESLSKKTKNYENRETLSTIMVDYDYRGNGEGVFDLDAIFFRDSIEKNDWVVELDADRFGEKIMLIYMDIFGNEFREVKTTEDFSGK